MIINENKRFRNQKKALKHKASRLAPTISRQKGEEKPEEELIWKVQSWKP
jgi:hypothetical protein